MTRKLLPLVLCALCLLAACSREAAPTETVAAPTAAPTEQETIVDERLEKLGRTPDFRTELFGRNVLGDNFWVWRADHGEQVGWDVNPAETGLVVNGDDVTIYALMVEHFRQYQTIWNGSGGKVIMYQSEAPYDVPSQEVYVSHDGTVNGFASYKVADHVESHEAIGIGIYSYNRDAVIEIHSAMEMPEKEDVTAYHVIAVMITGNPGITHPLNEYGESCLTGVSTSKIIHSQWNP